MERFNIAAAVAGEEVEVSEDINDGATWTLEKEDLLVEAWQARSYLYDRDRGVTLRFGRC